MIIHSLKITSFDCTRPFFNSLAGVAGRLASKLKHSKCLGFDARREFTSRRSELKKVMEGLFQQSTMERSD